MSSIKGVDLNALATIEAIGRTGSVAAASRLLNVTPGAVSQQLRKGEDQLGFQVFIRMPSGLRPTERGAGLLQALTAGFARIQQGVIDAKRDRSEKLTVSLGSVFAVNWLVPRLAGFSTRHPGIRLRIDTSNALVDFRSSDVDLAIRFGTGHWTNVETIKLWDQTIFPICSPALVDKLRTPADLVHVPIIIDRHSMFDWNDWLVSEGPRLKLDVRRIEFDDPILAFGAVLSGHGVMLGWTILAADALADGRLIKPFDREISSELAYWVVRPRFRRLSPAAESFVTWLLDTIPKSGTGHR